MFPIGIPYWLGGRAGGQSQRRRLRTCENGGYALLWDEGGAHNKGPRRDHIYLNVYINIYTYSCIVFLSSLSIVFVCIVFFATSA